MKFSRRRFLLGASTLAICAATPALAGLHFHGSGGPTQIPLLGNLVTRFSADAITPQGDNTTLTSWTDSVNGIVAGTQIGTLPKYRTARLNSKPSVQFLSGGLSIATPGAMKTAFDSLNYTIFIVFRTLGTSTTGALLATGFTSNDILAIADGVNVQFKDASFSVVYSGSSFSTFGTSLQSTGFPNNTGLAQFFAINGTSYELNTSAFGQTTNGHLIALGVDPGNTFPVNAEIFDILVWNTNLTPVQYMQAHMWAADKYAQVYPWAGLSALNVFFGDSLTAGLQSSDVTKHPAYVAAQTLGLTFGQWQDLGIGGVTTQGMNALAPTWVDPLPALIGKKINLVGFEWFNEQTVFGAPPVPFNDAQTYLAARKAVPNIRTVWGTSTAVASPSVPADPSTARNSYNTAFDGASTTNIDSYMSLHTDAQIGVSGAVGAHPTNFQSDGLHMTDAGYAFLAADFVAGINALP